MENPTLTGRFGYKNKMFSIKLYSQWGTFHQYYFSAVGAEGERRKKIKSSRSNIPKWSSQDLANSPQGSGFTPDCPVTAD